MIRSMTGFGRGHVETDDFVVHAEVRTVNNRSFRVAFRLPEGLQGLEATLEKLVRGLIARGTVSVIATLDEVAGEPAYVPDADAIRCYRESLAAIARELGVSEEVPFSTLVTLPGAVKRAKSLEEVPEALLEAVRQALRSALEETVSTREKEGVFIWKDMVERCRLIQEILRRVEARAPTVVEEYRRRLSARLTKLLEGVGTSLTEDDLRREIAIFADRCDISEEISRLLGHVEMLKELDDSDGACGRRLEFITQEMFREANTMASKASDSKMIRAILDAKAEIEKLREQSLNVE